MPAGQQTHRQDRELADLESDGQNGQDLDWEAIAAVADADGVMFSVSVTPHPFLHSYAMHMLCMPVLPLKVLQSLMGHKSISSTKAYMKFFALDVAVRHRVQFAMPESDVVAMPKRLS
jgi:site-specific recombinase XerD